MSLGVVGQYFMEFKIGDSVIPITIDSLNYMDVFEGIDRFLPTINLSFDDNSGVLTHMMLSDTLNTLTVTFADDVYSDKIRSIEFDILRKNSTTDQGAQSVIELSGTMRVTNLFSPNKKRGWASKSAKNVLGIIANEIGVFSINIDPKVDVVGDFAQHNLTNAEYLDCLRGDLSGRSGGSGFYIFFDCPSEILEQGTYVGEYIEKSLGAYSPRINVVSIETMLANKVKYIFVSSEKDVYDDKTHEYPIFNFEPVDDGNLLSHAGVKEKSYSYFDFINGERVSSTIAINDRDTFVSLSDYIMTTDVSTSVSDDFLGRNSGSVESNGVLNDYLKRVNDCVGVWLTTRGITDIYCGDIIQVVYIQGMADDELYSYIYSGYWLVTRVIHHFDSRYVTKLLLKRPGFDTDTETSFLKSTNRKK